jgi:hypothetical protein
MAFVVAVRGDLARSRSTDAAWRRRPNLGPQHAVTKRQTTGGARSAPLKTKENDMRAIFIAALFGLGIGAYAVSPSLAAPASGAATARTTEFARSVEQVYWRPYRHRHWWRHHWHHRWWY